LFKKDNVVFARIVFNAWDWRRDTLETARDQLKLLDIDSKEALNEALAKEEAELRDEDSNTNLWFRRAYLIFLTFLVMAGGWVGIAFVLYYDHSFYKVFSSYENFMATWFPMLFIATINLLMRPMIQLISRLEGWDSELERHKSVFVRSYLAGLFNTLAFVFILAEMLSDTPFILWTGEFIVDFSVIKISRYPSGVKEDYVAA
jgi:hypothetical protein